MINLHPPLSGFPLTLFSVILALEICDTLKFRGSAPALRTAIEINLIAAVLSVLAAFFSGYQGAEHASQTFQVNSEAIAFHHDIGRLLLFGTLGCVAAGLLARRAKYFRIGLVIGYYLLLAVCFIVTVYTGNLGGSLVFEHGAGVRAAIPAPASPLDGK